MPDTPSLKITKEFSYRGETKRFSNRYHFNGGTPDGPTEWGLLATAVIDAEKLIYDDSVTIVGWTGYEAGSDLPVASDSVSVAGATDFDPAPLCPGDCAAFVRYSTTARTTKHHPIYLGNYYHSVHRSTVGDGNDLEGDQKVALETYADAWLDGFSDGTLTYVRAGPNGATAISRHVGAFITHRDFQN